MTYYFKIPGEPTGKARPRVVKGHAFTPTKTVLYENLVKTSYQGPLFEGPVNVLITAVFGIPKSAGKAKREEMLRGRIMPSKRPDCDNIAKVICDGLNGAAWSDDAQVVTLTVHKIWGPAGEVRVGISNWEVK